MKGLQEAPQNIEATQGSRRISVVSGRRPVATTTCLMKGQARHDSSTEGRNEGHFEGPGAVEGKWQVQSNGGGGEIGR